MDIKIIIYFLLIVYYCFYKNNSIENMENSNSSIKNITKDIYLSDIKSINNLARFS